MARVVRARREVVLSGGAIHSPQLLMLSGIGDGAHLQEMGIETRLHAPGVGRNLQDHFQARMVFRANAPVTFNDVANSVWGQFRTGLEFALKRTGPLTFSAGTAGLFARVMPQSATPDVQFHFIPFSADGPGQGLHRFSGFTMSVCQLRPESRGTITLASPDPTAQAHIQANYLDGSNSTAIAWSPGLHLTRKLAATPALSRWIDSRIPARRRPPRATRACSNTPATHGTTIFHPSGTCRMGPGGENVVDNRLRRQWH